MPTAAEKREPCWVHCETCRHEWVPLFLPMDAGLAGRILKATVCPMCGSRKALHMGEMAKATEAGDPMAWVTNGDTGTSSLTIWSVFTGRPSPHKRYDIPHDPDDFGRCYRLLKVMPSWLGRLGEVAAVYPAWAPFVKAWDELTRLYEEELPSGRAPKCYARMQELRK